LSRDREVGDLVYVSRQEIVKELRRTGLTEVASAAETSLPDPVDAKVLDQFCAVYGLSRESLVDRMGGSP
jgi:hypothetical protein